MKEVNSQALKSALGQYLDEVVFKNARFRIIRFAHKEPTAVLISIKDYEHFLELEKQKKIVS